MLIIPSVFYCIPTLVLTTLYSGHLLLPHLQWEALLDQDWLGSLPTEVMPPSRISYPFVVHSKKKKTVCT